MSSAHTIGASGVPRGSHSASAEQAGAAASGPDIAAVQAVLTEPEPVQVEPTVDPVETDPQPAVAMVEVEFHPPPGATALVGGKTMVQAGYVQLPEGPNTASITFRNRRRIVCEFNAVNAGIVRLVEELDNNLSLHVTGEPSPVCQDVE